MRWEGRSRAVALSARVLGLAAAVVLMAGCVDVTAVQSDGTFRLQVGDRAQANGDFSVRFVSVPADSRCPAVCPTEGDAVVRLSVGSSGDLNTVELHTNSTRGPVSYEQDGRVIELLELTPWPAVGHEIDQSEYTAQLRLSHL